MKELWRAAADDYVSQGMSFAESRDVAEAYLDNPGFGGASVFCAEVEIDSGKVLDWTEMSIDDAVAELDMSHPGAIGLDEWLPRTQRALDALRERGYLWVCVSESFPHDTTTWIWLGDASDDEPELTAVED